MVVSKGNVLKACMHKLSKGAQRDAAAFEGAAALWRAANRGAKRGHPRSGGSSWCIRAGRAQPFSADPRGHRVQMLGGSQWRVWLAAKVSEQLQLLCPLARSRARARRRLQVKTCPSPRASEPVRFRLMGWQGREGSSQSTGPAHARLGGCPKVAHVIVLHNLQGHAQRRLQASQVVQAPHSHGYTERIGSNPTLHEGAALWEARPGRFLGQPSPGTVPEMLTSRGGRDGSLADAGDTAKGHRGVEPCRARTSQYVPTHGLKHGARRASLSQQPHQLDARHAVARCRTLDEGRTEGRAAQAMHKRGVTRARPNQAHI